MTLERELERARAEVAKMRERAAELEHRMATELERVRRSLRAEIVPYGAYESIGISRPPEARTRRRRGRSTSRSATRRSAAALLAEQALGDPADRLDPVFVGGLEIGQDRDRELAIAIALLQLGRLVNEGVVR